MTEDRKSQYIVQIGNESQMWDADKLTKNSEKLASSHPEAQVYQLDDYDLSEAPSPDYSYIVNIGGETQQWDAAKLGKNKDKLFAKYPDAKVQKVSAWKNPYLKSESQIAKENLDAFRAENGSYMDDFEARDSVEQKIATRNAMTGAFTPTTEGSISGEERGRYLELSKQEEALKKAYYNSSDVVNARLQRGESISTMQKNIDRALFALENDSPDAFREMKRASIKRANPRTTLMATKPLSVDAQEIQADYSNYKTAQSLLDDAIKINNAPSRYDSSNGFVNFMKGMGKTFSDVDFWSAGLTEIAENMKLRGVLSTVQEKLGNLNDLSEEAVDAVLTDSEKKVLAAFVINTDAQYDRAEDLSRALQAGQSAAESLGFMAEFILTGGIAKGATQIAESAANKVLRGYLGKLAGKVSKTAVGKYATRLAGDAIGAAARTLVLPSTYRNMSQQAIQIKEDPETGERKLTSVSESVARGFADSFIEALAEGGRVGAIGDFFGDVLGSIKPAKKFMDKVKKSDIAQLFKTINNTEALSVLRAGGWHGIGEEYLEEWYGAALRTLTHLEPEALKDFTSVDNQLITLTSFLPMTLIGGTISTGQVVHSRKDLEKKAAILKSAMIERGYSEDQANLLVDNLRAAPMQNISNTFTPMVNKMAQQENGNAPELMGAVADFAMASARMQAYGIAYEEQEGRQRRSLLDEMYEQIGRFWQEDAEGNRSVELSTMEDGTQVYILEHEKPSETPTEDGMTILGPEAMAVDMQGNVRFVNNIDESKTMSLDDYLNVRLIERRGAEEESRVAQETEQRINNIKSQIVLNQTILNMGTQENPIEGLVVGMTANGVMVRTEEGATPLTWDEVGNKLSLPNTVMTDAQIEEAEVANLDAQQAAREAMLDEQFDDPFAEESDLAEGREAEAAAEEATYNYPRKADGSVDGNALWNENVREWIKWNNQRIAEKYGIADNGADSINYLQNQIASLERSAKKIASNKNKETDFDKKVQLEDNEIAVNKRLAELREILAEMTGETAAEAVAETAAEETPAEPALEVPEPTESEEDTDKVTSEVVSLMDGTLTDSEIDDYINNNIKKAQKELTAHNKKTPKIGTDKQRYLEEKKKHQAKAEQIQAEIDFWNEVKSTLETIRGTNIPAPGEIVNRDYDLTPYTPAELVADFFGSISSNAPKIRKDSFLRHTGYSESDAKALGFFLRKNSGITMEEMAERIVSYDQEQGYNILDHSDSMAGMNALLEAFSEVKSHWEMFSMIKNNRRAQAESEAKAAYDAMVYEIEQAEHMTIDEFETYKEVIARDLVNEALTDAQINELNSIFAEDYYAYENNEINSGRKDTNVEPDVTRRDNGIREDSNPLLQGEQPDNSGVGRGVEERSSENLRGGNQQDGSTSSGVGVDSSEGRTAEEVNDYGEGAEVVEPDNDGERKADSAGVAGDSAAEVSRTGNRSDIRVFEEGLGSSRSSHSDASERDRREAESQRLIDIAKANGLYIPIEETANLGVKVQKRTGESVVYINEEEGKVYKVKDPYAKSAMKAGVEPEDAIFEFLIHNLLFPETPYTFVGITEQFGEVRIILSQDYVSSYERPTQQQIADALAERGLQPETRYSYANDLVSITDVEGDNVILGEDGTLYFIDPIIRFKKPVREILDTLSTEVESAGTTEDVGDIPDDVSESSLDEDMPDFTSSASAYFPSEEMRKKFSAMRARINEWAQKLGVQVRIMETLDDVTNQSARKQILKGGKVYGYFDPATGEVAFYLPDFLSINGRELTEDEFLHEIDATYIHEVVSHRGLRGLLGEEKYGELCDNVWEFMGEDERAKFMKYPGVNGDARVAADEFIAHFAEGVRYNDNRTLWDKIVDFIRNILPLDINIESNEDIAILLRQSYANLARNAEATTNANANQQAEAKTKAEKTGKKASSSRSTVGTKIEDFGEKIGGARKDAARSKIRDAAKLTRTDLKKLNDPDKILSRKQIIKYLTEGQMTTEDAQILLAVNMAVRGESYTQKEVALEKYRDLALAWESGKDLTFEITEQDIDAIYDTYSQKTKDAIPELRDRIRKSFEMSLMRNFKGYIDTYKELNYPAEYRDLKGTYVRYGQFDSKYWVVSGPNARRGWSHSTMADAIARIKKDCPVVEVAGKASKDENGKETYGHLYVVKGKYHGYQIKSRDIPGDIYMSSKVFPTRKLAEAYIAENAERLMERERAMAEALMGSDIGMVERQGKDYRNGRDVTPQDFMDTFGFRGVEFGNWVPQAERQMYLNKTYDAIMDFCEVVGISPKAFSLGGRLGLAFGARGKSRALAHYEPMKEVINLTRMKGAGSLAHEWFHALDNFLAKQKSGDVSDMATASRETVREEVSSAFNAFVRKMNSLAYTKRSYRAGDYWGEVWERAARLFENYVYNELGGRGTVSPLLVRKDVLFDESDESTSAAWWPYPSAKENEEMKPYFDALFDAIQEQAQEDGSVVLYRSKPERDENVAGIESLVERTFRTSGAFSFSGKETIESRDDIAFIFKQLEDSAVENAFLVFVKDGVPTILHVGMGGVSYTMIDNSVVLPAYKDFGADKVYMIHNHPSGTLYASRQDVEMLVTIQDMLPGITVEGIIINTVSGNYATFDWLGKTTESAIPEEGETIDLEVLSFDRNIFSPDYKSEIGKRKIQGPEDIASFLSAHRLGEGTKVGALLLNRQNAINGNLVTNDNEVSMDTAGDLATQIAEAANRTGSSSVILFGDFDYSDRAIKKLEKSIKRISGDTVTMLDIVRLDGNHTQSLMDQTLPSRATLSDGVRYRASNENQAIFVSNAARAVEGIKQEKATPEQWLKMIEKAGGLKAGEDKWMGLSDWLKASDKKTLTKQEVLDFVNENMIIIEEEKYGEVGLSALQEEFNEIYDNIIDNVGNEDESDLQLWEVVMNPMERAWEELRDRYSGGDDFDMAFSYDSNGNIEINDPDVAGYFLGVKPINDTRLDYTTSGLQNKQEIALVIPAIESWNERDEVHFGDAGDGRAVAWIRFGETKKLLGTTEVDGKKKFNWARVLVIDEIQSKRHQEGREKGYRVTNIDKWLKDNNVEVIETGEFFEFIKNGEPDRRFSKGLMNYDIEKAKRLYVSGYNKSDIPDAPFDKNWHELAMKRMLRYAAENGYDVVAWTKGDQQAERYNIGDVVTSVDYRLNDDGTYHVDTMGSNGYQMEEVPTTFSSEAELAEIFGKEIARKIAGNLESDKKAIAEADKEIGKLREWFSKNVKTDESDLDSIFESAINNPEQSERWTELEVKKEEARRGHSLSETDFRIGGEGMKGFYDKMLPAFMNKYGKKWGIKVEDMYFPGLENGLTMHSIPVTEEMKNSVMEGQVMYRARREDESAMEFHQAVVDEHKSKYNDIAEMEVFPINEATAKRFGYTLEKLRKLSGLYVSSEDLIAIFAKEDETDSVEIEDTIFHESVHKLVDFFDHLKAVGEWMWSVADKYTLFADLKKHIEQEYSEDEYAEEMMCFMLGGVMPRGLADELLSCMPDNIKKNCEQIFNEIGYDRTRESIARVLGYDGEPAVVSEVASEERREDEGRSRSEEKEEGSVRYRAEIASEVQDELDAIKASAIVMGNFMKAPNGKDTNLTEEQWLMVRTKNFKKWFGDWVNDPANSSKVVDENGEPLVVYHGTPNEFWSFDKDKIGSTNDPGFWGEGFYFTSQEALAVHYAEGGRVLPVFLNIRNPHDFAFFTQEYYDHLERFGMFGDKDFSSSRITEELTKEGKDGVIRRDSYGGYAEYVVFSPSQIKSATDNTGEFSTEDNDIRYRAVPLDATPIDEVVAGGLDITDRQVVELAGNLFTAFPSDIRKKITDRMKGNPLNLQNAIFAIPAELAEKESLSDDERTIASIIAREVQSMIDTPMTRDLHISEALWMLYDRVFPTSSYDLVGAAKKAQIKDNLGFSERKLKEKQDDIRYRAATQAEIDAMERNMTAADLYNRDVTSALMRLRESFQDMNRSVQKMVDAVVKKTGKAVKSFEDVMLALNQLSSKNLADKGNYLRNFLMPMWDAVLAFKEKGKTLDDVIRYVMLKHGLERNDVLAQRDARNFYKDAYDKKVRDIEADKSISDTEKQDKKDKAKDDYDFHLASIAAGTDAKYRELRERDYGAIMALYSDYLDIPDRMPGETIEQFNQRQRMARRPKYTDLAVAEAEAAREVEAFENANKALCDRLWKRINAATKETLKHQYEHNVISKQAYDHVSGMFQFYIPLRGFKEDTAEDIYSYYGKDVSTDFSNPLIRTKGRTTLAESPFGWIGSMAESAIQMDNKNDAKMRLYYFAVNRPAQNLLTLQKTWYKKVGEDADGRSKWEASYPNITPDMDHNQTRQEIERHDAEMKALAASGQATQKKSELNLRNSVVNISDKAKPEHAITVLINGEEQVMYVNGNPRAAQAINGMLNIDNANSGGLLGEFYRKVGRGATRWMSQMNTSYNPAFWLSNYERDLLTSIMNISVNEGKEYLNLWRANYVNPAKVTQLLRKYEKGELDMSNPVEKAYKEFADNGGVTGFTVLANNEEYDRLLEKYAKDAERSKFIKGAKSVFGAIQDFGEGVEQASRFSVFITSRQLGRPIEQAIGDAKDVTVNFNRKGSGREISWEETANLSFGRAIDSRPKLKWCARVLTWMMSGLAPAGRSVYMFFNASIQGLRLFLSLYKKHPNKMAMWSGAYFGLSLALVGLNHMINSMVGGDDDDYLDIPDWERRNNILIGGGGFYLKWAIPQEVRPIYALADIIYNKMIGRSPDEKLYEEIPRALLEVLPANPLGEGGLARNMMPSVFTPIYDIISNTDYKGMPLYRESYWSTGEEPKYDKAFTGTGKVFVEISRLLNEVSGGDYAEAGAINIHPASIEHLIEGYGGGTVTFFNQLLKTLTGNYGTGEWTIRNTPFLNRVVTINDERYRNSHTSDVFKHYENLAKDTKRIYNVYKSNDDIDKLDELMDQKRYDIMKIYERYSKKEERYDDLIRDAEDERERRELMAEQDEIRREMIKEISEL